MNQISLFESVHADLIFPIFSEVLDPRWSFVSTAVDNLQVSNLETRDSKERDLKLDIDRLLFILIAFWRLYCRQLELCIQNILSEYKNVLLMSCKLFDSPFEWVEFWNITSSACSRMKNRCFYIFRNSNKNINIISNTTLFIIAFNFNQETYFTWIWLFNNYINWK